MLNKIKIFITNHFNIVAFLIFAVVIFSLYGKTLFFDWQYLDDDILILDKQDYLKFSNIKNIFTDSFFNTPQDVSYRPLLNVSFLIDRFFWGTNPLGYHITNILIFLFCVFFIYLIFKRKKNNICLLLLCLVLAVHPILSTTLARIADRSDSLLTLFVLISIFFLKEYTFNNNLVCFFLHILFIITSLFIKETIVVFPIIYFIYLFMYKQINKKNICVLIFQVLSVLFFLICRQSVFYTDSKYNEYVVILKNIIISFKYLIKYFYNLLFPITFQIPDILSCCLFVVTILSFILIFVIYKYKNIKLIFFTLLSFVLCLLPTMASLSAVYSPPRIFLPMIFMVYLLYDVLKKHKISNKLICILVCLLASFFYLSFKNLDKFENRWTFYTYLLQQNPQNAFFYAKFAYMLADIKMYDEAISKYKKAIKIDSYNHNHYNNLAVVYMKKHDFINAKKNLIIAKNLKNDDENVNYNLNQVEKYLKYDN